MIVRELNDGRLMCIRQTTHALVSQAFCRHWGNETFARPDPFDAVLMAIGQHDNGWFEWEEAPEIRPDGYPMDFLAGPRVAEKIALWQRGMDRAYAQHPYAGLLIGEHAAFLYGNDLPHLGEPEKSQVQAFLATHTARVAETRRSFASSPQWQAALSPARLLANTRLLQFGDSMSLRLCVPWPGEGVMKNCPVDGEDAYTSLRVCSEDGVVTFEPWPFEVEAFTVAVHGHALTQREFASHEEYRAALAAASLKHLTWDVVKQR